MNQKSKYHNWEPKVTIGEWNWVANVLFEIISYSSSFSMDRKQLLGMTKLNLLEFTKFHFLKELPKKFLILNVQLMLFIFSSSHRLNKKNKYWIKHNKQSKTEYLYNVGGISYTSYILISVIIGIEVEIKLQPEKVGTFTTDTAIIIWSRGSH